MLETSPSDSGGSTQSTPLQNSPLPSPTQLNPDAGSFTMQSEPLAASQQPSGSPRASSSSSPLTSETLPACSPGRQSPGKAAHASPSKSSHTQAADTADGDGSDSSQTLADVSSQNAADLHGFDEGRGHTPSTSTNVLSSDAKASTPSAKATTPSAKVTIPSAHSATPNSRTGHHQDAHAGPSPSPVPRPPIEDESMELFRQEVLASMLPLEERPASALKPAEMKRLAAAFEDDEDFDIILDMPADPFSSSSSSSNAQAVPSSSASPAPQPNDTAAQEQSKTEDDAENDGCDLPAGSEKLSGAAEEPLSNVREADPRAEGDKDIVPETAAAGAQIPAEGGTESSDNPDMGIPEAAASSKPQPTGADEAGSPGELENASSRADADQGPAVPLPGPETAEGSHSEQAAAVPAADNVPEAGNTEPGRSEEPAALSTADALFNEAPATPGSLLCNVADRSTDPLPDQSPNQSANSSKAAHIASGNPQPHGHNQDAGPVTGSWPQSLSDADQHGRPDAAGTGDSVDLGSACLDRQDPLGLGNVDRTALASRAASDGSSSYGSRASGLSDQDTAPGRQTPATGASGSSESRGGNDPGGQQQTPRDGDDQAPENAAQLGEVPSDAEASHGSRASEGSAADGHEIKTSAVREPPSLEASAPQEAGALNKDTGSRHPSAEGEAHDGVETNGLSPGSNSKPADDPVSESASASGSPRGLNTPALPSLADGTKTAAEPSLGRGPSGQEGMSCDSVVAAGDAADQQPIASEQAQDESTSADKPLCSGGSGACAMDATHQQPVATGEAADESTNADEPLVDGGSRASEGDVQHDTTSEEPRDKGSIAAASISGTGSQSTSAPAGPHDTAAAAVKLAGDQAPQDDALGGGVQPVSISGIGEEAPPESQLRDMPDMTADVVTSLEGTTSHGYAGQASQSSADLTLPLLPEDHMQEEPTPGVSGSHLPTSPSVPPAHPAAAAVVSIHESPVDGITPPAMHANASSSAQQLGMPAATASVPVAPAPEDSVSAEPPMINDQDAAQPGWMTEARTGIQGPTADLANDQQLDPQGSAASKCDQEPAAGQAAGNEADMATGDRAASAAAAARASGKETAISTQQMGPVRQLDEAGAQRAAVQHADRADSAQATAAAAAWQATPQGPAIQYLDQCNSWYAHRSVDWSMVSRRGQRIEAPVVVQISASDRAGCVSESGRVHVSLEPAQTGEECRADICVREFEVQPLTQPYVHCAMVG